MTTSPVVHSLRILAIITCMFSVSPFPALGQTPTATVFVEVRDQTGAALPGVALTLTNQANGIGRAGVTSAEGTLVVPLLPAGTYTLTAALDKFKTEILRDIHVQAAVKSMLNVTLTPGDYTEQVVVRADSTTLRVGNSAVGQVFEGQTLLALPVNERDPMQFTYQAAGVATPAPGSRLSTQGNIGLNSSGAREASNNFLLDGVDNNDLFLDRLVVNPSLDAIQEFSLLQNTYDAEYGRSAGAQMNVVLKSGTSHLHGSAYEFFQDSALNAGNVFQPADQPKALLRDHQLGGTIGGPLGPRSESGRVRSFYFINVEGVRGREADTRLAHVPTAAERVGDFSHSSAVVDPFTGQPFPGNVIPAARLSAAGLATAALYPTPNRNAADANFVSSPVGERNAVQWTIKTDQHLWPESPFFVRYSFSRDNRALPFAAHGRNLPGFGVSVLDQGHNAAAGFTHAFSSRLFNDLRVGFNALHRDNAPQRAGTDGFTSLGITGPSLDDADRAYPTVVVPGYETLGDDPNLPVLRRTQTWHLSDSLTIDRNQHHVKAGAEFRHYDSDGYNHLFARGQTTFTGAYTHNPVADLLLGFPTISLLATNDNRQALRTWAANLFLQDDWRVTPTLTVNAGVRYEYNAPPTDADNRMAIFDVDQLRLTQVGTNGVSRSGLDSDFNNLAPRVGASWDLTGHGTLVLRGGYGIFYDSGTLIENSALYFNPPYFTLQLFFPGKQPLRLENPFPTGSGITPTPTINTLDPHFRNAYSHQASLGLERTFAETTLTARYVTTHGENMVRKRNVNQPIPGPGDLAARRPLQGFGDILLVESQASSSYHALQLSAVRRHSRNLSFRASYTFSKSMDDASAFLATDGDDNTPQNSRNLAAEWGPSDFDVRHRLVLTATYDVPALFSSPLLRDWQVSAIFTAQSGRPFTPRISYDNSNTGNVGGGTFAYDRPNELSSPPAAGVPFVTYDGRIFVVAAPNTFGNAGRNSLTGPGYASLDTVLSRRVTLTGARALELRLEIFNALNRGNYTLPDSFVDRATFGQYLSAFAPRQLQLAARFTF
jgi:outer membrane receptor protein involved in Fe transport